MIEKYSLADLHNTNQLKSDLIAV